MENLTVTFSSDDENQTAVLNAERMRVARVMSDKLFNDIAKKFADKDHSEMYFYSVLAIYEQARDIISFLGPKKMKLGLEV